MVPDAAVAGPLLLALLALLRNSAPAHADAPPTAQGSSSTGVAEKFSCRGRAPGFYADLASDCQMYHTCDDAGRLFTHACPERTRFQQRTMVCDHWYMVECDVLEDATDARAQTAAAFVPTQSLRQQHRHSQRVPARFPYQQRSEPAPKNKTISNSYDYRKIVTQESVTSAPRSQASKALNYSRETLIIHPSAPTDTSPTTNFRGQATTENPFRSTFASTSEGGFDYSNQNTFSESLRGEAETFHSLPERTRNFDPFNDQRFSTIASSSTPPSLIQKYRGNPYFENYFENAFVTSTEIPNVSLPSKGRALFEDEIEENKLEIVIPDPRKMFYIPDPNYDSGDVTGDYSNAVLVIDLPLKSHRQGKMKFQRSDIHTTRNDNCPRCHPSFLLPGQCNPCIVIR